MEEKKYNSDGEELFLTESGVWLPKKVIPNKEDLKKYYARFEHPKINFYLVALIVVLLIGLFVVGIITFARIVSIGLAFLIMIGIYILLFFIFINKLAIFCIRLYQRFAPMRIRERCVFTPTCSAYAIQAIKKYGIFKAFHMIIDRLKRCHGEHREDLLK